MAAVQVAQAPPAQQTTSVEQAETAPQDLSIEETLRIMDVATVLRREQSVVHQQLNIQETKAMLRKRLLDAAKVTGEKLTEEQVDLAIEHYYDKLHVFDEPEWSLELAMAHLYVMRNSIIQWTIAIGATAGLISWFW